MYAIKNLSFFLAFFSVLINSAVAQILNVENWREEQGKIEFSFNLTSNQEKVTDINTNAYWQYRQKLHTLFMISGINFIRAGDNNFDNSGILHLRYNYNFQDWQTAEIFLQGQYNRLLMIKNRELLGFGPRFRVENSTHQQIYLATLYMLERETLLTSQGPRFDHRFSNYLTYNREFSSHHSFHSTIYWQPLITNFSDYRLLIQTGFRFFITSAINANVKGDLLYDSWPAPGVNKKIFSVKNSIEIAI